MPDLIALPAPPRESAALASALGAARRHGPARGVGSRGLAALPPAFPWTECPLEDRKRGLQLPGLCIQLQKLGRERPHVHAHGGVD
eukprot:8575240-Alexandrium_andersonii.AAC.1